MPRHWKETVVGQGAHYKKNKHDKAKYPRVLQEMGCTWQSLGKSQVRLSARKGPPLKWGAFLRYPTTVTWTHFRPHMNPFQCHMKPFKWPCNPSTCKQGGFIDLMAKRRYYWYTWIPRAEIVASRTSYSPNPNSIFRIPKSQLVSPTPKGPSTQ